MAGPFDGYHRLVTQYDLSRETTGFNWSLEQFVDFYNNYIPENGTLLDGVTPEQDLSKIRTEYRWLLAGRPYYKVQQNIIGAIENTKLNIPASMLATAGRLTTFAITFPNTSTLRTILADHSPDKKHVLLDIRYNTPEHPRESGQFVMTSIYLDLTEDLTIEQQIQKILNRWTEFNPELHSHIVMSNMLRLALQTYCICAFLTDTPNEDLLRRDLAPRFVDKWEGASPGAREDYIRKSEREGYKGWNLGVHVHVHEDAGRLTERNDDVVSSDRELDHAHIRAGHLHCVRRGPGKKDVQVMWYRPIIVRPDKPFPKID